VVAFRYLSSNRPLVVTTLAQRELLWDEAAAVAYVRLFSESGFLLCYKSFRFQSGIEYPPWDDGRTYTPTLKWTKLNRNGTVKYCRKGDALLAYITTLYHKAATDGDGRVKAERAMYACGGRFEWRDAMKFLMWQREQLRDARIHDKRSQKSKSVAWSAA